MENLAVRCDYCFFKDINLEGILQHAHENQPELILKMNIKKKKDEQFKYSPHK